MDLDTARRQATLHLQLAIIENTPDERVELLRLWITKIDELQELAERPPEGAMQPGMEGPPQGPPQGAAPEEAMDPRNASAIIDVRPQPAIYVGERMSEEVAEQAPQEPIEEMPAAEEPTPVEEPAPVDRSWAAVKTREKQFLESKRKFETERSEFEKARGHTGNGKRQGL